MLGIHQVDRALVRCPAMAKPLATAYHSCDFSWEDLRIEAEPIVAAQERAGILEGQLAQDNPQACSSKRLPPTGVARSQLPSSLASSSGPCTKDQAWDSFYQSTARSAKFFKERRYLLLEFPFLASQQPLHVIELGCGYGASLLPVLKTNPQARATATDVAPTCLQQLREVLEREGVLDHAARVVTFVANSACPDSRPLFRGVDADVALIMFTLSAVRGAEQAIMLDNAYAALKPGGSLCIRDHGLFDMVQLRIPSEQWLAPNTYQRGDGTLAYFFSTQDLADKARAAGFQVRECSYVTVLNTNRKMGLKLRRVFVHGVFVKPECTASIA
ncbi:S-adenosyl-L-methionine-dependent methyltransferase [Haematococcus lacustris]